MPMAFGLTLAGGSLLTLTWAVLRGDVTPYVPFVSEAGTDPPQSGIFSLCLYICSVLGLLCVLVRFLVVRAFNANCCKKLDVLNSTAAAIAFVSFLGMAAVAAFPTSLVPSAHSAAANVLFFGMVCYEVIQTYMSFCMHPNFNGKLIAAIRLGITVFSFLDVFIMALLSGLGKHAWKSQNYAHELRRRLPTDEGFPLLVAASVFEWALGLSVVLFFFTYVREFKKVTLEFRTDILVEHMDDEPIFRKSPYTPETTYLRAQDT